jgi:hypothetical protein
MNRVFVSACVARKVVCCFVQSVTLVEEVS